MSAVLILLGAALAQDCQGPEECLSQGLEAALVAGDAPKALAALEKSCAAGEPRACFHKALLQLEQGESVEVPLSESGLEELKRRCETDQPRACVQLGLLHDKGPMALRDMSQASMFFRKACAGESAEGCKLACELGHADSCAAKPPRPPEP